MWHNTHLVRDVTIGSKRTTPDTFRIPQGMQPINERSHLSEMRKETWGVFVWLPIVASLAGCVLLVYIISELR